jgi:long-chain acyl-CoA synthetase
MIEFLLEGFKRFGEKPAVVWSAQTFSYNHLLECYRRAQRSLEENAIKPGAVVALQGDFSPQSMATLLALFENRCIVVPLTKSLGPKIPEFCEISEIEAVAHLKTDETLFFEKTGCSASHALLTTLKERQLPGLILFSSGSTGKSKGSVLDMASLLDKFRVPRKSKCLISFLLFDHIGGVNTILYALSNGGCIVTVPNRKPETIAEAIEKYKVEILPTTPTFLNLFILSEAYKTHDLSSLQLITYGTEPMPEGTLKRLSALFPHIEMQQTYGMSELGIMRSKSKSSDSLWVKIGGEGFETRVVDGLLEIKAKSAMLGYLNAPSPFTEDGWFKTGDAVQVDGEYMRILGRKSDMINVGGEKVFPAEIESVLLQMPGVEAAVITGEPNPITGQIVRATVKLSTDETLPQFKQRLYEFCRDKLAKVKTPQRIVLTKEALYSERFKQIRAF